MKFLNKKDLLDQGRRALAAVTQIAEGQSKPKRILIVENDPADLELLRAELEQFQCEVETVMHGDEAIKKLLNGHFDLMFLDLKLNGMSGLDVLVKCLQLAIEIPAIVLTGTFTEGSPEADKAWELGALFVARKPMRREQLNIIFNIP